MPRYAVGEVVWARVENAVTGESKVRPVLVLASWPCNGAFDYLVCFITTSGRIVDPWVRELPEDFMVEDRLPKKSFLRPSYVSSVPESAIERRAGTIRPEWLTYAKSTLRSLFE